MHPLDHADFRKKGTTHAQDLPRRESVATFASAFAACPSAASATLRYSSAGHAIAVLFPETGAPF